MKAISRCSLALALVLGISAPARSARPPEVDGWLTGFLENTLTEEWLAHNHLLGEVCKLKTRGICRHTLEATIELDQRGLRWLDANPAPACMQPAAKLAREWFDEMLKSKLFAKESLDQFDSGKMAKAGALMDKASEKSAVVQEMMNRNMNECKA